MKKSAIAAVVAMVALAVVYFATRQEKVAEGIKYLALPKVETLDVNRIEVTGAKVASLKKDTAGWVVLLGKSEGNPGRAVAADERQVKQLLEAVDDMKPGVLVTESEEKHPEYEVDAQKGLRVQVYAAEKLVFDLTTGKRTKSGGNFIRKGEEKAVYVGKGRLSSVANKDGNGWRKRALLSMKEEDVVQISVAAPGQAAYTLTRPPKKADSKPETTDPKPQPSPKRLWSLNESGLEIPEDFRFDADAAQRLSQTLVGLRAAEFADDANPNSDAVGLAGEHAVVTLQTADGQKVAVHVGKPDEKNRYHVRIGDDPQITLVYKYSAEKVTAPFLDLRDLTLVQFDKDKIKKVEIQGDQAKIRLEKADAGWALVEPKKLPDDFEFDPASVDRALNTFARIKGSALAGADGGKVPSLGAAGLSRPKVHLELTDTEGRVHGMYFGREVPKKVDEKGGTKMVYARGTVDSAVYLVGDYQKNRFNQGLEIFKKRAPPPNMGGMMGGGAGGLNSLPPDVRKKLQEAMANQGAP
jgi:hypothetical protein